MIGMVRPESELDQILRLLSLDGTPVALTSGERETVESLW